MKPFAFLLAALALLAALLWLLLDATSEAMDESDGPPRELAAPEPLARSESAPLTTKRERESSPRPLPERRSELATASLATVRGAILGGELRDAVLAFRAEDGALHFAALDPSNASYRLELASGAYRACFASPWAAPHEEALRVREGEREVVLDLEPKFWPALPVEVLTPAGTPLLSALGPARYGWRLSDGLGALGIELDCGGERTPLDLRVLCLVRVELPTSVQLRWGELVLGEQQALRAAQKLVFSVDPELFDRGPAARVELRAIDARTRAGLPRAEFSVQHAFGARRVAASEADGRCMAEDLAAGTLALRLTAPGYAPVTREAELEPGQALDLGELALEPDTALAAVNRAPVVRCELHVLAYPTQPVLLLEGASGTRELARWLQPAIDPRELPAGSYLVRSRERERALVIAAAPERQRIALP